MENSADKLVEQAIESVLEQIPSSKKETAEGSETSIKSQPWAEVAAPSSGNKRPISALVDEYAARVAADPEAVASHPNDPSPSESFWERFKPLSRNSRRRRRQRYGQNTSTGSNSPPRQPQARRFGPSSRQRPSGGPGYRKRGWGPRPRP